MDGRPPRRGQRASDLVCDERSDAVAEQRKRSIELRTNLRDEFWHQSRQVAKRSLREAILTARELDGTQLHAVWNARRPGAKERGAGTCMGKAEHAHGDGSVSPDRKRPPRNPLNDRQAARVRWHHAWHHKDQWYAACVAARDGLT